MEGKYGDIYADDSSYNGYYSIKFTSSTYAVHSDLSIDGKVISYSEMVCKGTHFFPINITHHYYVLQKLNPLTRLFL